jgi:hypothetical protein
VKNSRIAQKRKFTHVRAIYVYRKMEVGKGSSSWVFMTVVVQIVTIWPAYRVVLLGGTCPCRWRQRVPPKGRYLPTRPYDLNAYKPAIRKRYLIRIKRKTLHSYTLEKVK